MNYLKPGYLKRVKRINDKKKKEELKALKFAAIYFIVAFVTVGIIIY